MDPADNSANSPLPNTSVDVPSVGGATPVFSDAPLPSPVTPSDLPQTDTSQSNLSVLEPVQDQSAQVDQSAPPPPIVTAPGQEGGPPQSGSENAKKTQKAKAFVAGALVLLMMFGIGVGVFALPNQQTSQSLAWNCSLYTFNVSETGEVTVLNGSGKTESAQQVNVLINGIQTATLDVPALNSGEGASLGMVDVPTGGFSWSAAGTVDCEDSGNYASEPELAQCLNLKIYDTDWNLLSAGDLSLLSSGNTIRISVSGSATSGFFEAARFTINDEVQAEVTDQKPGTEEFYQEYEIPDGVDSFSFNAELKHSVAGWF